MLFYFSSFTVVIRSLSEWIYTNQYGDHDFFSYKDDKVTCTIGRLRQVYDKELVTIDRGWRQRQRSLAVPIKWERRLRTKHRNKTSKMESENVSGSRISSIFVASKHVLQIIIDALGNINWCSFMRCILLILLWCPTIFITRCFRPEMI